MLIKQRLHFFGVEPLLEVELTSDPELSQKPLLDSDIFDKPLLDI